MKRELNYVAVVAVQLALLSACATASFDPKVASDRTVSGFVNPESVGYDAQTGVLYAGNFGSPKLDPALKDGMGYISKVSLDGKVLVQRFLPLPGSEPMNKPKGIWIEGGRLWVTDIDSVWIFDLATRKGRKLPLPGVVFANDPAVMNGALYVSDNRSDQLVKVEPADFLNAEPTITKVFSGADIYPNGVYPGKQGLLMGGFLAPDKPKGLYLLRADGATKAITDPIGRIDGLYELADGEVLATDWNAGALFYLNIKTGAKKNLATGFKGPADFCVIPAGDGWTVVVPDLVQSHLRFIELKR